ncbi:T9SS C-terminal target domain-containing protein [Ancylomarina euxinus]|uniref:T9SS C-terminal target domain-containing protein n=1 Tax=Ancylomarina euxinus TaxID=2283627 RepID=A0A425XX66_9BACT|nr:LamG-like jellyroll fold domain-containing protein [Ancylomarina euxinus]MCZ4696192.1 T9SS type A sorting domain-containing protein [Ancylomarina euxinus]MUP16444.1 T9SS type A sorting domain-containing protein [Ancylomarina euxinus]RRG19233.1 T9SS C-terminal target domain-containing protein [Ancylomarina euxinus]
MHRILLSIILLLGSVSLMAQNSPSFFKTVPPVDESTPEWAHKMYSDNPNVSEVDYLYHQYYQSHPFQKNIHTQNFKHWKRQIQDYLGSDGYIHISSRNEEDATNQILIKKSQRTRLKSAGGTQANWVCLGPTETYNDKGEGNFPVSWQANVYSMDQSVSNPDILYVGSESGGVYKTTDKGLNWALVSKNEIFCNGVSDIKIAPSNSQIVFATANKRIYKTEDGAATWKEVYYIGETGNQLLIHPSNPLLVFCASPKGLHKSIDGGANWQTQYAEKCWDIAYHPTNSDVLYLLKNNAGQKKCEFFKSTDGGNTWDKKEQGWYAPSDENNAEDSGARIATSPAAPEKVYVGLLGASKAGDNGWIGVYKSTDAGDSWVNPKLPDGGPWDDTNHQNLANYKRDGTDFHQGFYNFAMAVSHKDSEKIWVGCLALSESTDGGKSWTRIGGYYNQKDIGWIHPDIQDLHVLGDDVWICTDGGVNYSNDELTTHESRKKGIIGSDFWGFGSGWNEDVLIGGRYHNGNTAYYQTFEQGSYLRLGGAEAPTGYVDPMNNRKTYFSDISTTIIPESLNEDVVREASLSKYPNESYYSMYSSNIEFDPRYADHMYLGEGSKVWKSVDGGSSFEVLNDFGNQGKVLEIVISRSNPKVMYCVFQPGGGYWDLCQLKRSSDGGKSWNTLSNLPAKEKWRLQITLNPLDENELWVISGSGGNGDKVYCTTDGGSVWNNMTTSKLDNESPKDILFQGGSNRVIYLATKHSLFYWNDIAKNWLAYNQGLPFTVNPLSMRPFYRDGKLRLATSRGIWETNLVEESKAIAQPIVRSSESHCNRDTIQFDCYSIIKHENASWKWSFDPEPKFVSSTSARNPKVVFSGEGNCNVTLTVTDGNGNTDSKTVENMVNLKNVCGADAISGYALKNTQAGDYCATSNLGIQVNSFTVTAWVKPNGIQDDYTGIVINNGTTAGFNFAHGNNTLAYHWPGGLWSWNSGLVVPADKWSYVAMVASPNGMSLYVDGKVAKQDISLEPVDLTSLFIGSYKGWDSRNFKGEMDEVCMWNRALTTDEIRKNRHLTKENIVGVDQDIIAYYQFNENEGMVLDKKGSLHARVYGGATRVKSYAPVGKGKSELLAVNAGGTFDFNEANAVMNFSDNGSLPNGDVVVTQISSLPEVLPNQNPNVECFWIINNYGSNKSFSALEQLKLSPAYGEPSEVIVNQSEYAHLYSRSENDLSSDWTDIGAAESVIPGEKGHFNYNSETDLTSFGQYFIACSRYFAILEGQEGGVPTGIPELELAKDRVKMYPNPLKSGSNELCLQYSGVERLRIRIFNLTGKLMIDQFADGRGNHNINSANLKVGIYVYSIMGDSFIRNGKLIVI